MSFGKPGRPPEDRLARQREIYQAVSPLIREVGARRLSMREAARAAYLSVGGLYHYFPNKRDLVLHALKPGVVTRNCHDFRAKFGHLAGSDPRRYADEFFEFAAQQVVVFFRPSVQAALELGAEALWEVLDSSMTAGVEEFMDSLKGVTPGLSEDALHSLGRALRRTMFAAMLDQRITPAELRYELRAVIDGYTTGAPQLQEAVAVD